MAKGIFTHKQVNQAIRQGAWSGTYAPTFVEYLVVAGGGSGGLESYASGSGGGGGAGGLLTGIVPVTAGTSYTVTVGAGGASHTGLNAGGGSKGNNGSNSIFSSITATGGGGGGGGSGSGDFGIGSGGSGGGGAAKSPLNGSGISGQGNAGGISSGSGVYSTASGGGGAGTVGIGGTGSLSQWGGNGGAGVASNISGIVTTYAGGGGGSDGNGILVSSPGRGGVGGGGRGGSYVSNGIPAVGGSPNTGGGGGGACNQFNYISGAGGSGIVIVRYPGNVQFYTGGAVTYANGHVVHTFYVTDTLAPTTPTALATSEYQISRSLRFNSADSAYLNRTPASATDRRTFTWSAWVKRGTLSSYTTMFSGVGSGSVMDYISFDTNNKFLISAFNGVDYIITTLGVFRDPSAWYHLVVAVDTTQATASNRIKLYVNGVNQTDTSGSYPTQNYDTQINNNVIQYVGYNQYNYWSGYLTEVNFIDGQALTPSSFGETNSNTGVWQPKAYTGTYGTNGFYLNFSDNSNTTAATLGKDYSGNGNNWTPNNFSVTAGVGNDSLLDTPTPYGTDTGLGGEVRGNYCTLNPLVKPYGTNNFSNGNLAVAPDGNWNAAVGTISMITGKWYWEFVSGEQNCFFGIQAIGQNYTTINPQNFTGGTVLLCDDNQKMVDGTRSAYTATGHGAGVVVGVAVDMDASLINFYKNGVDQGSISFATNKAVVPIIIPYYSTYTHTVNFGQRPFTYTAPSGYKALCTTNLPTPAIGASPTSLASDFFNTVLWTGDGSQTRSITGVGFQPDFTWMKIRADTGQDHQLYDAVRGAGGGKNLSTNTQAAEGTVNSYLDSDYGYLSSFDSDGFSVNDGAVATTGGYVNYSGRTYVAWNWKANGAGSSNTAGSITSTVSASTTSGFSVVTYASTTGTVGHGLGVAPTVIIMKGRNVTDQWAVYHISTGNTYAIPLNSTGAGDVNSAFWNNTTPTSTVFSQGSWDDGYNKVAYCFAPIAGYSAFGSYTGNGSADGPFVYTGFRPAYVMVKRTSSSGTNWQILDTKRSTYNVMGDYLYASASNAEAYDANVGIDSLSNGFKIRGTDGNTNTNSATYIYMAFAENPFKFSLAR